MRKTFTVLLCVALCVFTFVACSNEKDETATVSFNILDSSRDTGLTVSTSGGIYTGDIADLTWIYTATPIGTTYFTVGKTTDYATITMTKSGNSFTSGDITLSKGKWSFTLLGIDTSTASDTSNDNNKEYAIDGDSPIKGTLVYQGKVDEVLVSERTSIQIELSNIIEGTDAYLIFQSLAIQPLAAQTTYTLVPNRITIDNTVYQYSDSESGEKIIQSGDKITVKAGEHKVIISYVTKYDDGSEVINASATKIVTPATGQKVTIEGTILEDTVTANFNGIITDGSLGNVYDLDENKYYWLVEVDGEYVFKTDKDSSDTVEPTVNHNLELLDCSLSDDIPDEYITDTFETMNFSEDFKKSFENNNTYYNRAGYTWTVYHPAVCTHTYYEVLNESISGDKTKGFTQGYGTKLEPYGIASIDYWYNDYLYRDTYAYYKWAGPTTINDTTQEKEYVIDFDGNYLYCPFLGSFDFNGAKVINRSMNLGNLEANSGKKVSVIKNLKFDADHFYYGTGTTLYNNISNSVTYRNIEVSGSIMSGGSLGSFGNVIFLTGLTINFENCSSTAELVGIGGISYISGFLGYGKNNGATVYLNNSSYTGTMYKPSDSGITYNYVIADGDIKTTLSDQQYSANIAKGLYNSSWTYLLSTKTYSYKGDITYSKTESSAPAIDGATVADFYYMIEIGTDVGYYFVNLKATTDSLDSNKIFKSTVVHDYKVVLDNGSTYKADGFNESTFSAGGTNLSSLRKYIIVVQRESKGGTILKISKEYYTTND